MITAKPSQLHRRIFDPYLKWLFRRHFHSLSLIGEIPDVDKELPLLLLPNHSTWWDGFFAYYLNQKVWQRPFYLMMLEEQLEKYRFFRGLGAYGINRGSPRGIMESLKYTLGLMYSRPAPLICIFPQGELLPWSTRPLLYRSGIEWIVSHSKQPLNLLQLGIATPFLVEQLPEAFFLFGDNKKADAETVADISSLADRHELLLDDLQLRIEHGHKDRLLIRGKRSVHRTIDAVFNHENVAMPGMRRKGKNID